MTPLLAFLSLFWLSEAAPVKGVPPPPGGRFEAEITKVVSDRAKVEMKALLAELERTSQPADTKAEIKRRLAGLKVAVYTTPKAWGETVDFYEGPPMRVLFLKGERDILADLRDYARTAGIAVDPAVEKSWTGKSGKTARWTKDDDTLQIVVEDHLIDPRDGKVTPVTVVLVTSLGG
jgi:nitrogenase molybdenum-iron protein alpha/beta subunit